MQTVRFCTNSFEEWLSGSAEEIIAALKSLEANDAVDFISVGPARKRLDVVEAALSGATRKTFFVLPIETTGDLPNHDQALAYAKLVCRLASNAPAKTSVQQVAQSTSSCAGRRADRINISAVLGSIFRNDQYIGAGRQEKVLP